MTLAEFLLARIAEAEQLADDCLKLGADIGDLAGWVEIGSDNVDAVEALADRFSPARVLAECEAKRRIVGVHPVIRGERVLAVDSSGTDFGCEACHCIDPINDGIVEALGWCETLRALALPDADHPDYQEAWRA